MVQLVDQDIWDNGRASSKGNQLKWKKDGIWYKADYAGYEGLAEYVISHLLQKSTLAETDFVLYDLERIQYHTTVFHGVKSQNLLFDDWQIITLERLFKNVYGESLNSMIFHMTNHENRLRMMVEQTERITGIREFGSYISKMLTIDSLFLNEDRHTHNIALLVNGQGQYRLCPIFDQGAGLLSDTTLDYPMNGDLYELMALAKPKTFCQDFAEQLEIAECLYGEHIRFHFQKHDVENLLNSADAQVYEPTVIMRVKEIIFQQMRKYPYLFE